MNHVLQYVDTHVWYSFPGEELHQDTLGRRQVNVRSVMLWAMVWGETLVKVFIFMIGLVLISGLVFLKKGGKATWLTAEPSSQLGGRRAITRHNFNNYWHTELIFA